MADNQDISKLERKIYTSYHQDGILDIMMGISITAVGLMMLTDNVVFMFFTWLPFVLYLPVKRQVTIPRFGYVKFHERVTRTPRNVILAALSLIVLLAGIVLILGALDASGQITLPVGSFDTYLWLGVSMVAAILFLMFLFKLRVNRFVLYGLVFVVSVFGGMILEAFPCWVVIVSGACIVIYGIWLLFRFLRHYPLDGQEVGNNAN